MKLACKAVSVQHESAHGFANLYTRLHFEDVSPTKHDLEAEAMTTKILGIPYSTAWGRRKDEHVHPTSLFVDKRLADAVSIGNISNITTIEIVCENIRRITLDALVEPVDLMRSYLPLSTASVMLEK